MTTDATSTPHYPDIEVHLSGSADPFAAVETVVHALRAVGAPAKDIEAFYAEAYYSEEMPGARERLERTCLRWVRVR